MDSPTADVTHTFHAMGLHPVNHVHAVPQRARSASWWPWRLGRAALQTTTRSDHKLWCLASRAVIWPVPAQEGVDT